MTPEEFKQSEINNNYLPPFGGPYSEFDKGAAHGYSEGFDAALKFVTNIPKKVTDEDQEWMNAPMGASHTGESESIEPCADRDVKWKEGKLFKQKRIHIPTEYTPDLNEFEWFVRWDEPERGLGNLSLPLHPKNDYFDSTNLKEGNTVRFKQVYYADVHKSWDCAEIEPCATSSEGGWVNRGDKKISEWLPKDGDEYLFDGDEQPPIWARVKWNGKHPCFVTIESSGEENYHEAEMYTRYLNLKNKMMEENKMRDELRKNPMREEDYYNVPRQKEPLFPKEILQPIYEKWMRETTGDTSRSFFEYLLMQPMPQTPSPTGDRDCEELKERISELEEALESIRGHLPYNTELRIQQLLNKHP